jgi:DNA-binding NarL/FixJ family response regulator
MHVIGEAENGRQAVPEAERLRPDVVLMDLAMPLMNGVEAARQITKAVPSTRVLILSSYSDERLVQQAIAAGAAGFVIKEAAGTEVCQAIREVHNGLAFFSSLASRPLLALMREGNLRLGRKTSAILTSRQTEIVQLIAEGYATKQIADLLSLGIKTVKKDRERLLNKLNIHNIATLTRYALANGVIALNKTLDHTPDWSVANHHRGERQQTPPQPVFAAASVQPPTEVVRPDSPIPHGFSGMATCRKPITVTWGEPSASWRKPITVEK